MILLYVSINEVNSITYSVFLGNIGHNFNACMNLVNSIYFTLITLSTVGYGDIVPVTPIAKLFVVTFDHI
ncbi:hypothetical protein D1867_03115 [Acidianus infernus]|uniref:Potassium channel domain-containing protein n=2 Tax=Acidianus infernus TaxID=12915 RepID=A0A6A9QBI3_ACIIN|nr:ion channel [Acidianus infernus]MUM64259.1 hypothetical protein [Acidianus infernus]